jgi:DNA-3-methyladenine glycosylase I
MPTSTTKCAWCLTAPDYEAYHDTYWGTPVHDDARMFQFLILETFQAGLSWLMVWRKRDAFAEVFHQFDLDKMAAMTEADVERLAQDPRIIRNRAKIRGAIKNAQATLKLQQEGQGLASYFWAWTEGLSLQRQAGDPIPARTALSDAISADLKKRGFSFVGSTVIYAHLQATGIVNDHDLGCFRYLEVQA